MIRQASLAIGIAVFVAIVGSPASLNERVAAFHFAWWVFVAIVMVRQSHISAMNCSPIEQREEVSAKSADWKGLWAVEGAEAK
jgi:hypothetical protein